MSTTNQITEATPFTGYPKDLARDGVRTQRDWQLVQTETPKENGTYLYAPQAGLYVPTTVYRLRGCMRHSASGGYSQPISELPGEWFAVVAVAPYWVTI